MRFPPILAALIGCAVAIGATTSVAKPPKTKKVRCVKYTQKKGVDEQSVDVGLRNRCRFAVSCTVEWTVSCEDDDDKTPVRRQSRFVEHDRGDSEIVSASAAICGDGSWAVDDIRWNCEPDR